MIFWIWGSFSCGNISGSTRQAPRVASVSGTLHTHLFVHGGHGLGHPLHGLGHAVVWLERLYLQTDRLNVGFHQDELLDVPAGADQIFSHDLNGVLHEWNSSRLILIINPFNAAKAVFFSNHLSLFGHFLYVCNDLLLLLLQFYSFSVKVSHGSIEEPLILPQHLLRSLPSSKNEFHLFEEREINKQSSTDRYSLGLACHFRCFKISHLSWPKLFKIENNLKILSLTSSFQYNSHRTSPVCLQGFLAMSVLSTWLNDQLIPTLYIYVLSNCKNQSLLEWNFTHTRHRTCIRERKVGLQQLDLANNPETQCLNS